MALGYLFHFFFGFFFAVGYYAVFRALGRAGWLLGAGLGLVHGVFTGSALVNVLLPVVHPPMGTSLSSIESESLLEPPRFMMLNYGRGSPLASRAGWLHWPRPGPPRCQLKRGYNGRGRYLRRSPPDRGGVTLDQAGSATTLRWPRRRGATAPSPDT
jgi:hypothetical protein